MSDYGTMQARIADELARADLADQIRREILSAIAHFQRESFYFTEARSLAFSTAAGREFYGGDDEDDIPSLPAIDTVTLLDGTRRKALVRRSYDALEALSAESGARGEPEYFAYYGRQIRLYPVPDAAYALLVSADQRAPAPSAATDTNAWMTEAEELIRCRAKWGLAVNVIRDPELRDEMAFSVREAHSALRAETRRRSSSGRLRVDPALDRRA
jgi:hypothetical protein